MLTMKGQSFVFEMLIRADIPLFLWAEPGSGKTAFVKRWAEERGYRQHTLIGSLIEPADLSGLPRADGDRTKFLIPDWLGQIIDNPGERWLVMLDELNMAPPSVTAAMLRLVNERAVHDWQMPAHTRFVAAGNDPSQVSQAADLMPSMASRFGHIEWAATTGRDKAKAEASGWPVPEIPAADPGRVAAERARWSSVVAEFQHRHPEACSDFAGNEGRLAAAGRAYPCNRTWSMAVDAAAAAAASGGGWDEIRDVTAAVVSASRATEMVVYAKELDLPDPETWLASPEQVKSLGRDDRDLAAMSAVLSAVLADHTPARHDAGLAVCAAMGEAGKAPLATPAVSALLHVDNSIPGHSLPERTVDQLTKHFQAITEAIAGLRVKASVKRDKGGED